MDHCHVESRVHLIPVRGRRRVLCLIIPAFMFVMAGCQDEHKGGPRVEIMPVTGKVLVDGQPRGGVGVVLRRTSERKVDFAVPEPAGGTDEDGNIQLSTYVVNDGVAPGEYKVLFTLPDQRNAFTGEVSGDAFKGKYNDYHDPQFTVTIPDQSESGSYNMETFELSTKD